jgi:oxygen-dependent protoporphyrinogen oxidase
VTHIATGVTVTRVERDAEGTWAIAGTRDGEPVVRRARSLVLAVPAYVAATLVRDIAPDAAQGLAAIPYAPIAIVASVYRRADIANPLAGFGFLVPRRERRRILGCLFSSSMFEGRAPEGSVLLTTFVGGVREPALASAPDAELAAIVAEELGALLGARTEPSWNAITRWTHAIPQYNLGHAGRLHPVEEAERALPGLAFCANYRGGVSVGDRIKSSRAMSDGLARFLVAAG